MFLLSLLIFLPLLAGLAILFVGDGDEGGVGTGHGFARSAALVVACANALASLGLLLGAEPVQRGVALAGFEEKWMWIEPLGIQYLLRVDGLSTFLVILAAASTAIAVAASWNLVTEKAPVYFGCMLLLSGGMIGVLCAMDLFLFYVFWEIMLIPAFFLVGVFGGPERRPAVIKFVIFTMAGSLLMLVSIVFVGYQHFAIRGNWTFAIDALYGLPYQSGAMLAFLSFVAAFGIKAAIFPLHTWLPATYSQAPMPVTFLLSAVMAKLGIYGLLRIALPLFPDAAMDAMPVLAALATCGVVYAAFIALVQEDARMLAAYASISHLGVILLGVFSLNQQAYAGSVFHMVGHAVTTGAMFLLIGFMAERRGSTLIADWGGATRVVPVFASFFMLFTLAAVGLPGLGAFVGEFLIFVGAFQVHQAATAIAVTSIIFGAAYMLWWLQRAFFGPVVHEAIARMPDLSLREGALLAPIVVAIIGLGVFPQPMLAAINPTAVDYLKHFGKAADAAPTGSPDSLEPPTHRAGGEGHGAAAGHDAPAHAPQGH